MPSPLDSLLNPTAPQLRSPWANLQAQQANPEPRGYIAGANGENVIRDYQPGGKYGSNQVSRITMDNPSPNLQTLSSGGENHMQSWTAGRPSPQKIQGPFQGMPDNLAQTAQKNLSIADNQINAFNEKAKMFSYGSAHTDIAPTTTPARQTGLIGSALDRKAYDQSPNPNLVSAGAPKVAIGVEDRRQTEEEE